MTNETPLTKSTLVEALNTLRDQLKDDFLDTLAQFEMGQIAPKLDKMAVQLETIKADMTFVKRDIADIKAAQSTTVELKDFLELKRRVEKLEKYQAIA